MTGAEKPGSWLYASVGLALGLLLLAIWGFRYLPLTDLPEHALAARILVDYGRSGNCYSDFFSIGIPWKPYSATFFWFAELVSPLVTPLAATKIYLSLALVLTILAMGLWLKVIAPGRLAQLLPATILLYSCYFFVGMINTLFAIPFFFLALWCSHRILHDDRVSLSVDAGLAACLLVIYFSHVTMFGAIALVIGVLWLASPHRARGLHLALAAAPAVAFLAAYFLLTENKGAGTLLKVSYDSLLLRSSNLLLAFNVTFDRVNDVWIYEPDQLIVASALALVLGLGLRKRVSWWEGVAERRHLAVVAIALVAGTLFLPSLVGGTLSIGIRFGYPALLVILVLIPAGWSRSRTLRAGMMAAAFAMPVLFAYHCWLYRSEMRDLEGLIRKMPSCRVVLPVLTELDGAGLHNYAHLHAADWYCYWKGGTNPYTITRFSYFPVRDRCKYFTNPPQEWKMYTFNYSRHGEGVEYFLVRTGESAIIDDLKSNVPLLARRGDWYVFGPNVTSRASCDP